jgi:hypothetical protein
MQAQSSIKDEVLGIERRIEHARARVCAAGNENVGINVPEKIITTSGRGTIPTALYKTDILQGIWAHLRTISFFS